MSHERVVVLLGSHKVRIARALVRQMRGLSPRYAALEQTALEENLVRLLGLIARFLETGDESSLKSHASYTAQLRQALGFELKDFMLANLSFMPVLRRFLVESAPTVEQGLADYEALEAVALPLLANAASLFEAAGAEFDEDDEDITVPTVKRSSLGSMGGSPFSIEQVTGGAEDEMTGWR